MESAHQRLAILQEHLEASRQSHGRQMSMSHTASSAGLWTAVPQAPPDAILGVTEAFKSDKHPNKLNLGVGAYRTEEGKPLVLESVRRAERALVDDASQDKEYLPIGGNKRFCALSAALAFGVDSPLLAEQRAATVQSLSGTGALRVGAAFLAAHYPAARSVYLPKPTWPNHHKIFAAAGLDVRTYRYYHAATRGLDYDGMIEDLRSAEEGAVVLLHACAHNPTGVDPTLDQWRGVLQACTTRRLLPFFDSAYQGFASGDLDRDAAALRLFAGGARELMLAQSYAKNMGMYGERVGALTVVCLNSDEAQRVGSQLQQVIRPMYSSPPRHGAAIATAILDNPQLNRLWQDELRGMAQRIARMRRCLYDALRAEGAPGTWQHILDGIGMFAFTGLQPQQVEHLTREWHVYLTKDGRISMAGLSQSRCAYLAAAIKDAVTKC